MKWSLKIGRFAGIDVFVHASFFLLIGWVALLHWRQGQGIAAAAAGVLFILTIFLCVVLHEFGHALMAARYGIKTRDIILLPIGGVARMESLPAHPLKELWVALAGPAVNVVIAFALFLWLRIASSVEPISALTITTGPFLERILAVNVFMVVFNMIPAFPMDGGRVLRALLATRKEYGHATRIAVSIGRGFAALFGFVGFFYNPFLLFIALFVWFGATREEEMSRIVAAVRGIPVRNAMTLRYQAIDADVSLAHALDIMTGIRQKVLPVISRGRLTGVLTEDGLLEAIARRGPDQPVASAIRSDCDAVEDLEMMESVFAKINDCECDALPVTRDGSLVGLVTKDGLGRFARVRAALGHP